MASKKSFKADINPAMQFISAPADKIPKSNHNREQIKPPLQGKAPEGYKPNPLYIETKSRRLQLLVQPSLHTKLKARAVSEGKSINDLVHSILEDALQDG